MGNCVKSGEGADDGLASGSKTKDLKSATTKNPNVFFDVHIDG